MKKYTKPNVIRVALNPEQAVLGTCSVEHRASIRDANPLHCKPDDCKQRGGSRGADFAAHS